MQTINCNKHLHFNYELYLRKNTLGNRLLSGSLEEELRDLSINKTKQLIPDYLRVIFTRLINGRFFVFYNTL